MQPLKYQTSSFLILVGLSVTVFVYLISGWSYVVSAMHEGAIAFSIVYIAFVFLSLTFLLDYLRREHLWKAVLSGIFVGYFGGFVSYFTSVLLMPEGAARLINSASIMGSTSLAVALWIPIVLLCWVPSALSFLIVSSISKAW
jgi:hypothetical protein